MIWSPTSTVILNPRLFDIHDRVLDQALLKPHVLSPHCSVTTRKCRWKETIVFYSRGPKLPPRSGDFEFKEKPISSKRPIWIFFLVRHLFSTLQCGSRCLGDEFDLIGLPVRLRAHLVLGNHVIKWRDWMRSLQLPKSRFRASIPVRFTFSFVVLTPICRVHSQLDRWVHSIFL